MLLAGQATTSSFASAQTTVQARDHVRAGLAYAERGKWEDALREFEEAYALDPQPLNLYDVAQARLKTRRFRAASEAFARLVESPGLSQVQRDRAREGVATAREHVGKVRVSSPAGRPTDTLTVDGAAVRVDESIEVDPGRHVVRVVREGETFGERTIDVADGAHVRVTIAAPQGRDAPEVAPTRPTHDAPSERGSSLPTLGLVLAGASVVALGVGTFFEIRGLNDWSDLKDGCGQTKTCAPGAVDDARTTLLVGDIGIGIGIAAAVAAAYVFVFRPGETSSTGAAARPASSPRSSFAVLPSSLRYTF